MTTACQTIRRNFRAGHEPKIQKRDFGSLFACRSGYLRNGLRTNQCSARITAGKVQDRLACFVELIGIVVIAVLAFVMAPPRTIRTWNRLKRRTRQLSTIPEHLNSSCNLRSHWLTRLARRQSWEGEQPIAIPPDNRRRGGG